MTTFTGKLSEYSFISIDRFNGGNLNSSVYFLSHCHKDHIEGLLDKKFIERLKLRNNDVKLYTSETTKNLMICDKEMEELADYVIGLPIHQPTHLSIKTGNDIKDEENIVVTLLSAGHCVGSVMILFEGNQGNVLYTGDFRLRQKEIIKISQSLCKLKSIYVDTTFCCPNLMNFPTREKTKDCIIEIISSWISKGPHYIVHLKCKGRYGYEYIMKEIARYFDTKLHVNNWRLRMSARLPNMLDHFTTVSTESQIHCCYFGKETFSGDQLPCRLQQINGRNIKLITIVPSSLYFIKNGVIPEDGKVWLPKQKLWRVFHSMHASYNEIREVIRHFKPENIYPCVPPVDCQDIIVAFNRLQDLQCKKSISDELSQDSEDDVPSHCDGVDKPSDSWKQEIQKTQSPVTHDKFSPMRRDSSIQSPPPMRKRKNILAKKKLAKSSKVAKQQKDEATEIMFVEETHIEKIEDTQQFQSEGKASFKAEAGGKLDSLFGEEINIEKMEDKEEFKSTDKTRCKEDIGETLDMVKRANDDKVICISSGEDGDEQDSDLTLSFSQDQSDDSLVF